MFKSRCLLALLQHLVIESLPEAGFFGTQPSLDGIFIPAKFQQIPAFHPAAHPADFPLSERSAFTKCQNLEPFPGGQLVCTWATRLFKISKRRPNRSQQTFMDWDYIQCVPSRGRHPKQAFRHFILK